MQLPCSKLEYESEVGDIKERRKEEALNLSILLYVYAMLVSVLFHNEARLLHREPLCEMMLSMPQA
jgi:hypothetical protein